MYFCIGNAVKIVYIYISFLLQEINIKKRVELIMDKIDDE